MKQTKHTPGPWVLGKQRNTEAPSIDVYEGETEYRIAIVTAEGSGDITANARLIASAPMLLEALRLVYEKCEISGLTQEQADGIAALITNTTGESHE